MVEAKRDLQDFGRHMDGRSDGRTDGENDRNTQDHNVSILLAESFQTHFETPKIIEYLIKYWTHAIWRNYLIYIYVCRNFNKNLNQSLQNMACSFFCKNEGNRLATFDQNWIKTYRGLGEFSIFEKIPLIKLKQNSETKKKKTLSLYIHNICAVIDQTEWELMDPNSSLKRCDMHKHHRLSMVQASLEELKKSQKYRYMCVDSN